MQRPVRSDSPGGPLAGERGGGAPKKTAGLDLHRIWKLILRRRFYLILPFLVIGLFVGAGLRLITPVYTSSSKLLVEERGPAISTDIDRRLWSMEGQRMQERNRLAVMRETLRSEELLLKVIRTLRLREDPVVLEEARLLQQTRLPEKTVTLIAERILVSRLREKIWVDGAGANIYLVRVSDNNPVTSWRLNEAITRAYLEQEERQRLERQIESLNFTDEEFAQAREELATAEDDLQAFKRSMLTGSALDRNPVNKDNARTAEGLLRLIRLDREDLVREHEAVVRRLVDAGDDGRSRRQILSDPEVTSIQERLTALEREDYLGRLEEAVPGATRPRNGISAERQKIGVQRNRLSELIEDLVTRVYANPEASLRADLVRLHEIEVLEAVLSEHEREVGAEYRNYSAQVQEQPAQEAELRRLENAVDRAENFFESLVSARTAGETTQRAQAWGFGTRIRVIEPARKPLAPSSPNKPKIGMVAAILSLGIGLGAVFLAEYVDSSFKDVDEVEAATGLEVIGTLPRFGEGMQWEAGKRRRTFIWRFVFAVGLVSMLLFLLMQSQRASIANRVYLIQDSSLTSPVGDGR